MPESCSRALFRDLLYGRLQQRSKQEGLAKTPVCITKHMGFQAICLNHWVLQTTWYQYKQRYHNSYKCPAQKQDSQIALRP